MDEKRIENLGPAERIINALLAYTDHMYHNRPGFVVPDARHNIGVRWEYAVPADEEGKRVLNRIVGKGRKATKTKIGEVRADGKVVNGGQVVGEFRPAGIFPEVAAWMYRQIAEVWKLDNEFAARWASYAFGQEHRDLKVVLAAFMLCQSRKGDPVLDQGKLAFYDEDFRDVGEAMALVFSGKDSKKDMSPKMLLRVYEVLTVPAVAAINRELGFGRSARNAHLGRWEKAVHKWLLFREENPKLLAGLVKAGFKSTVQDLVRISGYKPQGPAFFEALRWKQRQAKDGRRTILGVNVSEAESWNDLTEQQICERIVRDKPNWKKASSLLPKHLGATRAIMMAAIEAGSFSSKDLIIAMPTLEDLGLLQVQEVKDRVDRAVREADDTRAANVALRLRNKENQEKAQEAADNAMKKAVEEVVRDMRIYLAVDRSGSMEGAIVEAKRHLSRFVQGFPMDKIHICEFNTVAKEVKIRHPSAAGVENAFAGVKAGGGTDYRVAVQFFAQFPLQPGEDALFLFVGDEGCSHPNFAAAVEQTGLKPMAFGLVPVVGPQFGRSDRVRVTAARLGIPCFEVTADTFADPYAIPRTIRNLIAATPVNRDAGRAPAAPRLTLVDTILKTDLLRKPAWAA